MRYPQQVCGPVVQLVRTPACHAGGRRFEPVLGRHIAPENACENRIYRRSGCGIEACWEVLALIITTTPGIEGKRIVEYRGVIFGEVVSGVDFVKDFAAGLTNFFGGRSYSYEGELIGARDAALHELESRAYEVGANAVVGVDVDYEILGTGNNMIMVIASGTAVVIQ